METRRNVRLTTIDSVKKFVSSLSKYPVDADLISGRYIVDAKSIMGIFSLDLSKPIELVIQYTNEAVMRELASELEEFFDE